jgi:hypothetical protein
VLVVGVDGIGSKGGWRERDLKWRVSGSARSFSGYRLYLRIELVYDVREMEEETVWQI